MDEISEFQEIKILLIFIKYADETGSVDFGDADVCRELDAVLQHRNWLDASLFRLNDSGVLYYEEIGEDGFKPFVLAGVTSRTHERLMSLVISMNEELVSLQERISEILTFDPKQLSKTISETSSKLEAVEQLVSSNKVLESMDPHIQTIKNHFDSVKVVSDSYEHIYKNIIRPVQEEGKSGVRATVKWAIVSIVVSTGVSLIISNWSHISPFLSAG